VRQNVVVASERCHYDGGCALPRAEAPS
jgi:hypothetical protein